MLLFLVTAQSQILLATSDKIYTYSIHYNDETRTTLTHFRYKEPLTLFNKEEMILKIQDFYKTLISKDIKIMKFDIEDFIPIDLKSFLEIDSDIAIEIHSKGLTEIHSSSKKLTITNFLGQLIAPNVTDLSLINSLPYNFLNNKDFTRLETFHFTGNLLHSLDLSRFEELHSISIHNTNDHPIRIISTKQTFKNFKCINCTIQSKSQSINSF